MRSTGAGSILSLVDRVDDRLKCFRLCSESKRVMQAGKAQFRFQRDIEREGDGTRSFASRHIVQAARPVRCWEESELTRSAPDARRAEIFCESKRRSAISHGKSLS
jgi:hypothetical protein